ncbi:YhdP family protein [Marinicellulosiphila megalodicopiae]|uniref:YhdP family phospholipid transporter n=1 Tax=Marinicellulosiphila megalodicopiae TaxID=2724896 RepID=UPI003BB1BC60
MIKLLSKLLHWCVSLVWTFVVVTVLVLAVLIALGKQFTPNISNYKSHIEALISKSTQQDVVIGNISATWVRLAPEITFENIQIGSDFSVEKLKIEPSVIDSIWQQKWIMEQLSISGLALTVNQNEEGFVVSGYKIKESKQKREPVTLKKIDQFLKQQHRVQINDLRLGITLKDSPPLDIFVDQADLSTLKKKSWLIAKAQVNAKDQQTQLELQLDSNGQGFFDAYIKHDKWDWTPWLTSVFPDSLALQSMQVSGEHWLRLYGETLQSSTSLIQIQDIALKYTQTNKVAKLQNFSTQFNLNKMGVGQSNYQGTLKDLTFSQNKEIWQPSLHEFSLIDNVFEISSDIVDIDRLAELISPFDDTQTIAKMNPKGKLLNSTIQFSKFDNKLSYELFSEVTNLYTRPANGSPGVENFAGYIKMNEFKGHFSIENQHVKIWDAGNFEEPLAVENFKADLYWQTDEQKNVAYLYSPNLHIEDQHYGKGDGQIFVTLYSEEMLLKGYESTLALTSGLSSSKKYALPELYPTKDQDIEIRSWILQNIFEANIERTSFIFNGPIISKNKSAKSNASFLLSTDLNNVSINFDPTWQSVYDLAGRVTLENKLVYANITKGEYYKSEVFNAKAEISGDASSLLYLTGLGKTTAQHAKTFLTTSPIRYEADIGNTADLWEMKGDIDLDLQLRIPFSADPVQAWVKSDLKNVTVIMPEEELGFEQINGQIIYDDVLGVSGKIDSVFFGEQIQSVVSTQILKYASKTEPSIWDYHVNSKGFIDIQDVARWFGEPVMSKFNGRIEYDALFSILQDRLALHLETDLVGADFDELPEPIGKPINEARPTIVDVSIFDDVDDLEVVFNYDGWLDGKLLMEGDYLTQGVITNTGPLDYRSDIGIYVDVDLDYIDIDYWIPYIMDAQELNETNPYNVVWPELPEGTPTVDERIKSIVLKSKTALAGDTLFHEMYATMVQNEIGWVVDYKNIESKGQIGIPFSDFEPVIIAVDYLALTEKNFPESAEEEIIDPNAPEIDLLAQSMSPKDLPITAIDIRQISYEGINYGSWQLQIEPHEKGLNIKDVRGVINGVEANGNLNWFVDKNNNHVSSMQMKLMTPNTTQTLKAFKAPPAIKAAKTEIELALNWKGSPYLFKGSTANGTFKIAIDNGVITQLPDDVGPAVGLFKFIGLLNASKIFSRIALDFTDIMKSGQSFDSIRAEVVLSEGVATISSDRKFSLDSSSLKFSGFGNYNMLNDNVEISGQIIVPFSSTIATVGLLSGIAAPPAAAIIFFSEKIFNKGLEKLTTWHFNIVGNINNLDSLYPEVKHGGLKE